MRKLVTVRNIGCLRPIDGADFIEVAEIDGWQCIVKKGEFSEGDPCVFFEIDSFLPAEDERYEFLTKRGTKKDEAGVERVRIKSMKMRKELSQGLALPLNQFPEISEKLRVIPNTDIDGEYLDFSGDLNVIKFERPEPQQANAAGRWPHFLQKTDEERIQNLWNKYSDKYKDVVFVPTLKLDGSSCTIALADERIPGYELEDPFIEGCFTKSDLSQVVNAELGHKTLRRRLNGDPVDIMVCSRNLQLKHEPENHFWTAIYRGGLIGHILQISTYLGRPVAIQGEVCGPKVCKNQEKLNNFEFFAFNIYDILNGRYLDYSKTKDLFLRFEIQHVPEIEEPFKVFQRFNSLDELLQYADGPSLNAPKREGVVFKSIGENHPISFKCISNEWLLSGND